jgi:hypothetical protein
MNKMLFVVALTVCCLLSLTDRAEGCGQKDYRLARTEQDRSTCTQGCRVGRNSAYDYAAAITRITAQVKAVVDLNVCGIAEVDLCAVLDVYIASFTSCDKPYASCKTDATAYAQANLNVDVDVNVGNLLTNLLSNPLGTVTDLVGCVTGLLTNLEQHPQLTAVLSLSARISYQEKACSCH